jgi:hypothetical protein
VFAYTWRLPDLSEEDPRRTYVELTLEPHGTGTRLRVTESGFAQLPCACRECHPSRVSWTLTADASRGEHPAVTLSFLYRASGASSS